MLYSILFRVHSLTIGYVGSASLLSKCGLAAGWTMYFVITRESQLSSRGKEVTMGGRERTGKNKTYFVYQIGPLQHLTCDRNSLPSAMTLSNDTLKLKSAQQHLRPAFPTECSSTLKWLPTGFRAGPPVASTRVFLGSSRPCAPVSSPTYAGEPSALQVAPPPELDPRTYESSSCRATMS